MKALYNHRMKQLREISQRLLPKECLYTIQSSGGLFASIHLPDFIDTEDLIKRLENRGVDVLAGFVVSSLRVNGQALMKVKETSIIVQTA